MPEYRLKVGSPARQPPVMSMGTGFYSRLNAIWKYCSSPLQSEHGRDFSNRNIEKGSYRLEQNFIWHERSNELDYLCLCFPKTIELTLVSWTLRCQLNKKNYHKLYGSGNLNCHWKTIGQQLTPSDMLIQRIYRQQTGFMSLKIKCSR